jgi:putative hemolysin
LEIIIIIGLVLLNGVFSMAEMAVVSSRKFKLESAKKKGIGGAATAIELAENPTRFLSTVQIGITLIGILLGVYSGENLTIDAEAYFVGRGMSEGAAHNVSVFLVVLFITYLSILLGELLPKRLGLTFPEGIAMALSRPMKWISWITAPFVWLLTRTNDVLLRLMGIRKNLESRVSEEEIKSLVKEGAEGGEIQDIEHSIVQRVFELGDRKVGSMVTHRNDLVYFNADASLETIRAAVREEKHSAYPVCQDDDIDHIIGIVLLKDLAAPDEGVVFNLRDYLRQPLFINEGMYAYQLLEMFKKQRMHYGILVDEYGITQGIVTMDDVVDALVGDVTEWDQDEYQITQRGENSWLVDGLYPIHDFVKYFDMDLPEQVDGNYNTVAGLLIAQAASLPNVGYKMVLENLELEVVDKDGQRVDKILVTRKA